MTTTAISSQTAAAASSTIVIADSSSIQVWTDPAILGSGERVQVSRTDGDSVEVDVIEQRNVFAEDDENILSLSPKQSSIRINGPGNFKLSKTITAVATAVYYD